MTFRARFLRKRCCLKAANDWAQFWRDGIQTFFGFPKALKVLGILPEGQHIVNPNHFSKIRSDGDIRLNRPCFMVGLPSTEAVEKAKQCLKDNGIEADETGTVLEALGYILFNADITQKI